MKTAIKNILGLTLVSLITFSCSDSTDSTPTPTKAVENPKVKIISPAVGTMIDAGDSITVIADLTHSQDLHEYGVRLSTGSTIYMERTFHSHTDSTRLIMGWRAPSTLHHVDVKIEVEATDHENRKGAAEVSLHVHG